LQTAIPSRLHGTEKYRGYTWLEDVTQKRLVQKNRSQYTGCIRQRDLENSEPSAARRAKVLSANLSHDRG
tara:strand:- start:1429 stop:1638 length:210 start_codon:yes stop_codon:yes gene_type:complete